MLSFLVGTTTNGDEGHSEESSQQPQQGQNPAPTSAQEGATAGRRSDSDAAGFDQDWVRRSREVTKKSLEQQLGNPNTKCIPEILFVK